MIRPDDTPGMAQDDIDEFSRLWRHIVSQAAWMAGDDPDRIIALLAKGFADAIQQIQEKNTP